jgi:alpha-galactosidase
MKNKFGFCLSLIAFSFLITGCGSNALNHNLAPTPPMGWNSWNKFGCNISFLLAREIADAMVSSGMKDAGYQYITLDDCWQLPERQNGHLVPNPETFPNGVKPLADYLHAHGLKLGIYSDRGRFTCEKKAGSYDHESTDAQDFADWGVDYVKYDNCNEAMFSNQPEDYKRMRACLNNCGRPIIFSICAWSFQDWMPNDGDLWRTTGDITDKWDRFVELVDTNQQYASYSSPSHWNDPDMLEIGNGGMTDLEYRSQFSMWAVMASPLIAGNDLRTMSPATRETLTNKEVIAIDQDPLGQQGTMVESSDKDLLVYAKNLSDAHQKAVVLFNRTAVGSLMTVHWKSIGLADGKAKVRDLWLHKDLGEYNGAFKTFVPSHGIVMVQVTASKP